jgi:hypothetical protein
MTVSRPGSNLGRHVFGVASVAAGVFTLAWHDYTFPLLDMWNARGGPVVVYAAATAQVIGGAAIQFRRTAKAGAAVLGAVYLLFALVCVPPIVAAPKIYNNWGNFFEQFSLVSGATIAYARLSSAWPSENIDRAARLLLGTCVAFFALEQAFYLDNTVALVPKWLPPNQMVWAVTTTVLFGLAAVALLTNHMALLATRLLTMMLLIFGLVVWIPLLLSDPHNHPNWSEAVETFAIAGAAWILADLLGEYRRRDDRPAMT